MKDSEIIQTYIDKFLSDVDMEYCYTRRGTPELNNKTSRRLVLETLYYSENYHSAGIALYYGNVRNTTDRNSVVMKDGKKTSPAERGFGSFMAKNKISVLFKKDSNSKSWKTHIQESVGLKQCSICEEFLALESFENLYEVEGNKKKYNGNTYRNECRSCHAPKQRGWTKTYKKENRGKVNASSAKRRAKVIKGEEAMSKEEWKEYSAIFEQAREWENLDGLKRHVDHIIPLSKGGENKPHNLQILLQEDNLKKSDRILSDEENETLRKRAIPIR